ncbi:hypothetical protein Nepgr_020359 [Nepenthes gracilis]|uniref:Uncharacterized protein n=1 Tax=Nepenthes gracilis TaxID=150966 RepID=A0AAD3SVW3_NEPGR|nr:hypothetical protein Nepgr_020359 [Nepenthes gracilis]
MDYVISGCPTTMKDCTGGLMQLLIVSLGVVWKNPHVADVSTVRASVGSCYRLLMLLLEVDGFSLAAGAVNAEACRNEHVLLSYSEPCRFKENGECLHAAGHIKTSYANITKQGVEIYGAIEPGKGAPPLSLQPISTEDRLVALGRSLYHDEVIGSTEVGSSQDGVPADPPGGVPMSCTSIGILRKNIAKMHKQFDDPRDRLVIPPPFSIDGLPSPKDGGSSICSLQKSKRSRKKNSPIPHN